MKELKVTSHLKQLGLTYDKFKDELIRVVGIGKTTNDWFLYTPLLKRVLETAILNSKENKESEVSVTELFLSLLEEGEGIAIRLLMGMNIDIDSLYQEFSTSFCEKKVSNHKKLLIEEFSVNLNKRIVSNEIDPVIGREDEIKRMIEILCRRTKNNPLLLGEAGVGKTAIVEKIAYLMNSGNVPTVLKNKKIFNLDLPKIVANTIYRGELEGKLNRLITTLDKHDNIILFIDEIHMIMGAGSCDSNKIDVANFLKPYLSSGKVQVIGATTKEEYEKSILNDKAFRRRFNIITVSEPDKEMLIDILMMKNNNYEKYLDIEMEDSFEIINMLTDLTSKEHRNYQDNISNPALAVNILGRAFAYAAIDEKKNINKADFKEAILEEETIYQGVREDYARRLTTKSEKVKTKVITFPKK